MLIYEVAVMQNQSVESTKNMHRKKKVNLRGCLAAKPVSR